MGAVVQDAFNVHSRWLQRHDTDRSCVCGTLAGTTRRGLRVMEGVGMGSGPEQRSDVLHRAAVAESLEAALASGRRLGPAA